MVLRKEELDRRSEGKEARRWKGKGWRFPTTKAKGGLGNEDKTAIRADTRTQAQSRTQIMPKTRWWW